MRVFLKLITLNLIGSCFLFPHIGIGAVNLPWSTTFNCPDWKQGNTLTCDGFELFGDWSCLPSGISTGGSTTTIIDTSVNFINRGISVGNHVIVNHTATNHEEDKEITSITTTTNLNDTLNFSAMVEANVSGDSYRIYDHKDGVNPDHALTKKSQIISDANYLSGRGGRGFRFYTGNGRNVDSGTIGIKFNSPQKELWIRWYMRYPSGYKYNPQSWDKLLYIRDAAPINLVVDLAWGTQIRFNSGSHVYTASHGWDAIMVNGSLVDGHRTGDGLWHYFEVHIEMDTTNTPDYDGVGHIWVDGVLRLNVTNANFSLNNATARNGWTSIQVKSNQAFPQNDFLGSYVDIDDVAISNTGYIGPISGSLSAPAPPKGLTITK